MYSYVYTAVDLLEYRYFYMCIIVITLRLPTTGTYISYRRYYIVHNLHMNYDGAYDYRLYYDVHVYTRRHAFTFMYTYLNIQNLLLSESILNLVLLVLLEFLVYCIF